MYDDEVDNAVEGLTSMLEPVMIVFLALIVGTIVIAPVPAAHQHHQRNAKSVMKISSHTRGAFTLIELLVVIAIIAILAGLTLGTAGYVRQKAARQLTESQSKAFEAALERYKAENGDYPRVQQRRSELHVGAER